MKKIVIITGATSGIGRASAAQFAKESYKVIIACRNEALGLETAQALNNLYGTDVVTMMQVDMSSLESIRSFCNRYQDVYDKLDVLIHNAGCFNHGVKVYQQSVDGLELTFATNVFGPFLMSILLKEQLKKSGNGVIVGVASTNMQHFFDLKRKIDFEDLEGSMQSSKTYDSYKMYGDSKMALSMLLLRMGELFKEEQIRVNAVMISGTKISKKRIEAFPSYWRVLAHCQNLFSRSQEYMANNYYLLCEAPEFKNVTGQIISGTGKLIEKASEKMSELTILKDGLIHSYYYPIYTENQSEVEKLWELCSKVTKRYIEF